MRIAAVYSTMPVEQLIPAIATTAAVTLLKVGGTALTLFFIRKGIDKFSKRKE